MKTVVSVLRLAKHDAHMRHLLLAFVLASLGWLVLHFGDLIGWTFSTKCLIASGLSSGSCWLGTWASKREHNTVDKVFLFSSVFCSILLLVCVTGKIGFGW